MKFSIDDIDAPIIYDQFEQGSDSWWAVRRGIPTASGFIAAATNSIMELREIPDRDNDGKKIVLDGNGDRVYLAGGKKPRQVPDKDDDTQRLKTRKETISEFRGRVRFELGSGALSYAAQLVGDIYSADYWDDVAYESEAMRIGKAGEAGVRAIYAKMKKTDFRQVAFITTADGRFGCSPDSVIGDDGGLEIKRPQRKKQVLYLNRDPKTTTADGMPLEYLPQVHGCLWITKRKWWDFISYVPGLTVHLVRVYPSEYTARLGIVMEEFYSLFSSIKDRIASMELPSAEIVNGVVDAGPAKNSDEDEEIIF